jgi:hypothetical protein
VVDAQRDIRRVTADSYQGHAPSTYRAWLQRIDKQTVDKPDYTSYIGVKVAQHFETGWGVGVVCCIAADPRLKSMTRTPAPDALRPFVVDGYIGLGVPIGTDAFIQHFVKDKCQAIMDDVDKLDNIQDGFIQYQLLRFCQATRLQYLNGQIDLANQNSLQQQHVDFKISNTLLKKGTREAYKTWTQQDRAWVDMRLHELHEEVGFGVSHNTITRHAASYTTNARFVAFLGTFARPAQQVWLPGNDLEDPTTWDAPSLCTLKRLHGDLLRQYDCTERASPQPPPPSAGGNAAANAVAHPQPPAGSQDHSNGTLLLPQLDRLHLAFKRRQVSPSSSSSTQDPQAQKPTKSVIPTQKHVTEQLTKHWSPFKALRQHYAGTRFEEQR